MTLRRRRPDGGAPRPPTSPLPVPSVAPSRAPAGLIREVTDVPPPATPPPAEQRSEPAPPPAELPAELAGRFSTGAGALAYVGELLATGYLAGSAIRYDEQRGIYWVSGVLPGVIARELAAATGGRLYIRQQDSFVAEQGWGPVRPLTGSRFPAEPVDRLSDITVLELVRRAGLQGVRPRPLRGALVFAPGLAVADLVRRSLELDLRVTHYPVELRPLFSEVSADEPADANADGAAGSVYVAVQLDPPAGSGETATLPSTLLEPLRRNPLYLVCRMVADRLVIQDDLASPLIDSQLQALVPDGERWLLADAVFGCAQISALAEPQDSAGLVRLGPGYRIEPCEPGIRGSDIEPMPVKVVARRTAGALHETVDAVLLDDDDVPLVILLLENHKLADRAWLARGGTKHLMFAAGGLLERLPVGEPLHCLGPGALYLPIGHCLSPAVPPSARAELFGASQDRGIVLQPGQAWKFDISVANRLPIWNLWVGVLPAIEPQVAPDVEAELLAIEADFRQSAPAPAHPQEPRRLHVVGQPGRERNWKDDAFDAQMAGDLLTAAQLFERHGEHLIAAQLYEEKGRMD